MEHDPSANWVFHEPKMFGETMMVSCTVTAFNKPITMHLPVMDHRNQAVKNPDAVIVNKNMMRCLVKAIACHGLGLSVYAGEDLPHFPDPETGEIPPPKPTPTPAPTPAPTPTPKAPEKIEGKPGQFQISITADPKIEAGKWVSLVIECATMLLNTAMSEADVMNIFKVNRNIFDQMKLIDGDAYKDLMTTFADTKAKFKS
jgi:hypothetical protein